MLATVRPYLLAEIIHGGGVLDKLVRPADADHRRRDLLLAEQLQHAAAIAAGQNVVLQSDDQIRRAAKNSVVPASSGLVKRGLMSADVKTRRAPSSPRPCGATANMLPRPNSATLRPPFCEIPDHFRFADFQQRRLFLQRHALRRAARVADEYRMPLVRGGEHHVRQFVLVLRAPWR